MMPLENIAIGTAKFGINYGVGNRQRRVSAADSLDIFAACNQAGVNMYDTAPGYGESEGLLGENKCADYARIVTKVGKISQSVIDASAMKFIEDQFEQSLKNIAAEQLYGLLIHSVDDLMKPQSEKVIKWLYKLKQQGRVTKIGVSVYTPEEARELFEKYDFDLIQIPYNLFDQRFGESGTIDWLKQKNVEVHARSLFLKGLLLKADTPQGIPNRLYKHCRTFYEHIEQLRISAYDVCMQFANINSQVDRWVIGISSKKQLDKLINWRINEAKQINFSSWRLDDEAIDPRFW